MRFLLALASSLVALSAAAAPLKLNDKGYYETRGLNVLVFSNWYDGNFSDSKISGVELIHHGVRTATNGDVRLMPTPGQWDDIGSLVSRNADAKTGVIETHLRYADYGFDYTIRSELRGNGVVVSVVLDKALPKALEGKAGFNLEFLPAAYFHHSYMADGKPGEFPLYPNGPMHRFAPPAPPQRIGKSADSPAEPLPIASGNTFVLSPEDPARRVTIASADAPIAFYDGRNEAQNGWYVLRSMIPAGKTGRVVEWTLTAATIPNWTRAPVIAHSQVGYAPDNAKVAVIELDRNDHPSATAEVLRVNADGTTKVALKAAAKPWAGHYLRYDYRTFDFSTVREPGLYILSYEGQRTAPFRIGNDIYADTWHATNDIYFPVAMDHMLVSEAYRVWHGNSHMDDARQAPINHEHIDLWAQGPSTDDRFKPGEHIPGINVGGWYDAGDFDLPTESQYSVVLALAQAREDFGVDRDETSIDEATHHVEMHVPDGKPDVLQQVEHGIRWLLATQKAVGFAINGVTEPYIWEYHHLGDAVTKTDGFIFDPKLKPGEVKNGKSGTDDDRWAFTNRSTPLNYGSAAAFAAASRVLRGYNDELADECLKTALHIWDDEHSHAPFLFHHGNTTGEDVTDSELMAATELLKTTHDQKYAERIQAMWPKIHERFLFNAAEIGRVVPLMPASFKAQVESDVRALFEQAKTTSSANPFGVPISEGGWAGDGLVVALANAQYQLHKAFPELVGDDLVFRALDYLYGTHPGSNISLVSGVGSVSKEVAYGNNRADFTFIAGGVVPGVLILKPDFPENKEDWPFLWGENEYVIALGARYYYLANAANALANGH